MSFVEALPVVSIIILKFYLRPSSLNASRELLYFGEYYPSLINAYGLI